MEKDAKKMRDLFLQYNFTIIQIFAIFILVYCCRYVNVNAYFSLFEKINRNSFFVIYFYCIDIVWFLYIAYQ